MIPRRFFWISGWSIPPARLRAEASRVWPQDEHIAIAPSPDALDQALATASDFVGGFSFGAHLLLRLDDPRPRLLLAPFIDLKAEAALGGAVATTQIKHLLRWLKRDAAAAIADFHQRIGFTAAPATEQPHAADLAWGLEQMLAAPPPLRPLPPGSLVIAGQNDPLLDVPALSRALPGLHVIDTGHQLQPLLAAAARLQQDARS